MADQKNAKTGAADTNGVVINVNSGPATKRSKLQQPKPQDRQRETTEQNTEDSGPTPLQRYLDETRTEQPIDFQFSPTGGVYRADAKFATTRKRFRADRNNIQPAEFYEFHDPKYKSRGYI